MHFVKSISSEKEIWQTAQNQFAELQVSNMQKKQLLNGRKKGIDGENILTQKNEPSTLIVKKIQQKINAISTQKLSRAFIQPFQKALPFTWLFLLVIFIFPKRSHKRRM